MSAPQLFVSSFAALIAAGTIGLRFTPAFYTGPGLGWVDSLFTATSAVCVTGLIVVDTATYFSVTGQAFLLLLIQLGGLGMIAFTTFIILVLGRRLSLRNESLTRGAVDVSPDIDVHRLGRDVVRFTVLIEAAGALALLVLWAPEMGWRGAIWPAVFHAISAFCNAGFSTFSDSLMGAQRAPAVLFTVMALVIAGGIGFLTLEEFAHRRRTRGNARRQRLSTHSRLVLGTTAALLVGGWGAFALFEWNHVLRDLPTWDKLVNALFMSVTPRTAGFNTIDYTEATVSSNFLTVILMMIGGSPGSTAGGMKTTTFVILGLLALSRLRGWTTVRVWKRSIREETVQRAIGLAVVAFSVVTAGIFALTWSAASAVDPPSFLSLMFEAASAFNTVGLTMNLTPSLAEPGRLLLVLLMFVGRVGPLTFAASLVLRRDRSRASFRYAYEDVAVG